MAIVTAKFEIPEKHAKYLENHLRGVTAHVPCSLLEISHAESIQQQLPGREVEPGPGREQQSDGVSGANGDAAKKGVVAGSAGKDAKKPKRGSADKRKARPVSVKKQRSLTA